MKTYLRIYKWIIVLVINIFGLHYSFMGLNYNSDAAVIAGSLGLATLGITDYLVIRSAFKGKQ